ncbi:hypothetical protein QOZ80_4BG0336910 [Eleusine coracana subsp. coracana]|nr:hypothetical protein QOZ80_4BG0336910 [Eleusine coracana subsp. coracana]
MRSLSLLLLAAVLTAAACADEPASARRSLTFVDGLVPARPRSESDKRKCLENVVALGGSCKHELILASFFPDRLIPRACCRAADEVDDHCGPLTRAFFRAVLPRDLFRRCERQAPVIRAPPTARPASPPLASTVPGVSGPPSTPIIRAPPPLATVPGVSGAPPTARPVSPTAPAPPLAIVPPAPEAQTSARLPPKVSGQQVSHPIAPAPKPHASAPRAPKVSGGAPRSPIAGSTSVSPPPPYPVTVPRGKHATPPPPPKTVSSGTYAPVVSGGSPRAAPAPRSSAVPVNEDVPKPKSSNAECAVGATEEGCYGPETPSAADASAPPKKGAVENAPVVSGGGPCVAGAPRASAVPVNEDVPKPKVISAGGSAGGRTGRAPATGGVYGPATPGAPLTAAASAPPKKGATENDAGGSSSGQTRRAPAAGYGSATDAPSAGASSAASNYGELMGTLYPTILP